MEELRFESLKESHFTLIHRWFNKPHVQAFYSLKSWTLEEVQQKLAPYLQQEKQMRCFVIYHAHHPVGYVQSYPVKDHPWENQDLPDSVTQKAAGLDLFIGESEYLGKGFGPKIINSFLKEHLWPFYQYCLTDPDIRNEASIRVFQKCGFVEHKKIFSQDALWRSVSLQLFIKEKESLTIWHAKVEDAHSIAEAERQIAQKPGFLCSQPSELTDENVANTILSFLKNKTGVYLVAQSEDQLVGHAFLEINPLQSLRHVANLNIAVHLGWQGKGIGKKLLQKVIEEAKSSLLIEKIQLYVRASNVAAISLYKKMGFQEEGILKNRVKVSGYYLDDIIMGLDLL